MNLGLCKRASGGHFVNTYDHLTSRLFGDSLEISTTTTYTYDLNSNLLNELTGVNVAGRNARDYQHALITEYGPGAAIGWHRDKGVFGDVIGISLLSPCLFRFRRKANSTWERYSLTAEPRSAYLLRGAARTEWEHSIPAVDALRYSITFRSLRSKH